jgi:hypothetical protein
MGSAGKVVIEHWTEAFCPVGETAKHMSLRRMRGKHLPFEFVFFNGRLNLNLAN